MFPVRNTTSALFLFTIRFVWSSLCFIFIHLSMRGDNWWWRLTSVYFISLNWQFSKGSLHHFPDEKTVSSLNFFSFIASTRTESLCRWTELKWLPFIFFHDSMKISARWQYIFFLSKVLFLSNSPLLSPLQSGWVRKNQMKTRGHAANLGFAEYSSRCAIGPPPVRWADAHCWIHRSFRIWKHWLDSTFPYCKIGSIDPKTSLPEASITHQKNAMLTPSVHKVYYTRKSETKGENKKDEKELAAESR